MISNRRHTLPAFKTITLTGVLALLLTLLSPALFTRPAFAAGASITLTKSAPSTVLLGSDIPYTLTITNPDAATQYNISVSDVLPEGMKYKAGSVSPNLGNPTLSTTVDGKNVITWSNIVDLPQTAEYQLSYEAEWVVAPDTLLGTETNSATAAGSTDAREVPQFTPAGTVVPEAFVYSATDSTNTDRAPFEVIKTARDGEMLRGVHDQRNIYTLTVKNNKVAATENLTVTDYLPAQLEYLQCGNEDNSTVITEEYVGSGPLGVPAINPTDCDTPTGVETVQNYDTGNPDVGTLAGVWTKVDYTVPDLAPGDTYTIKYVAGIPLQANTMSWAGTEPTPGSLEQGSNLDNNNGASTRETTPETSITNHVIGEGFFTGNPEGYHAVSGSETVTIEDVRMNKTVDNPLFTPGGAARFTMNVDVSEYMDASNIAVTDNLPDGYCPLGEFNYSPPPTNPLCAPTGDTPTPDYTLVTPDMIAGGYEIVFEIGDVSANGTYQIEFGARMLPDYRGTDLPVVFGDTFRNTAALFAYTNPITPVQSIEHGLSAVEDEGSASQHTVQPSLAKKMKPNTKPVDCNDLTNVPYQTPSFIPEADRTFQLGDTICFRLTANFDGANGKNVTITDFLPVGTNFVSATPTASNTVTIDSFTAPVGTGPASWVLGTDNGGNLYVNDGETFDIILVASVTSPAAAGSVDLKGNLLKMASENTPGQITPDRDQAEFNIGSGTTLTISKGVAATTVPAATFPTPGDNKTVGQGSKVTWAVKVTNDGDITATNLQIWDYLPAGLNCSTVSNYQYISTSGSPAEPYTGSVVCADPPVNGQTSRSLIEFTLPDSEEYAPQPTKSVTLLFDTQLPSELSVSKRYTNDSYIRSYDTQSNTSSLTAWYPADNVDTTIPSGMWNAVAATDPSDVAVPNATVTKTSSITEARIGESYTYTYGVQIPANSTVYNGQLYDTLPTGVVLKSIDGWGVGTLGTHEAGFTLDTVVGTNPTGKLLFPNVWSNNTNSVKHIIVQVTVQMTAAAVSCATDPCVVPPAPAASTNKTNTAKFDSNETDGGTALPTRTRNRVVTVVQPNPVLAKTANPTALTSTGDTVTYTLAAANTGGRPTAYGASAEDCVPEALTVDTGSITASTGTFTTSTSQPGCDGTYILWEGFDLAADANETLTYDATLTGVVPGSGTLTNTATMLTTSMIGTVTNERTYKNTATATVTAPGANLTKTVTPEKATFGQTVEYTVTGTLDKNLSFYGLSLVDALPTGVDPASVNEISADCEIVPSGDPCDPLFSSAPLTRSGQKIGWTFNNLGDNTQTRKITLVYTAKIRDTAGIDAGDTLTNSAVSHWSPSAVTAPTTIAQAEALTDSSGPVTADVTVTEPNVQITKRVNGSGSAVVTPGEEFTYTVEVSNPQTGNTSNAYDLKVVDDVPNTLEIVSVTADAGSATNTGNSVTWNVGTLAVDDTATMEITAKLKPTLDETSITNTATIDSYYSFDLSGARSYTGGSDSATVTPTLPSLSTEKYAGGLAYINQPYTWTVVATNTSATKAYNVAITDVLPPNWTYTPGSTTITLPGGTVITPEPTITGTTTQTLTWVDITDLNVPNSILLEYQATPTEAVVDNPGVGMVIDHTNTANSSWRLGPDNSWNTGQTPDETAVTHIAAADMQLMKSHTTNYPDEWGVPSGAVVPGGVFNWNLTVSNSGMDDAEGVVVTDTLPEGFTAGAPSAPTTDEWTCHESSQTITCEYIGTFAAGDTSSIVLPINVDANWTGPEAINTATVTADTYDPNPVNNTGTDTVTPFEVADLAIVKTSTGAMTLGAKATYTLTVTNYGPSNSPSGIVMFDRLPEGLTVDNITADPMWNCIVGSDVGDAGVGITKVSKGVPATCTSTQPFPTATQSVITVDVTVDNPPVEQTDVENGATVHPVEGILDPDLDNNHSAVTDPLDQNVALRLEKTTTGANPVYAGNSTEFTITVHNDGPAAARNVTVTDTIPTGLSATKAEGTGWDCYINGGIQAVCSRDRLNANTSSNIVITAKTDPSLPNNTTLTNTATVISLSPQPGGVPGPASSTVTVLTDSDLSITKTHLGNSWKIGKQGTWNLDVTNHGPSTNPGPITVTDTLAKNTSFVSGNGNGWTCQASGKTVTCTKADGLGVNETSQITIVVNVNKRGSGTINNTATVSSAVFDSNKNNNTATDSVNIRRSKQSSPGGKPTDILNTKTTDQGQKIKTRVLCTPARGVWSQGDVAYCKVVRKNGRVHINVYGSQKMKVTIIQTAKGNDQYLPWKRVKTYIVKPNTRLG